MEIGINQKVLIDTVLELFGGREHASAIFEADDARIAEAWERDTAVIGRILRAHLFVEHFLGEYLARTNPRLGSLDNARLSFSQKVSLIREDNVMVQALVPGIRHLNVVRNRIAHRLAGEITGEDADVFLRIRFFDAMRKALLEPEIPSADPIDVLEDFSRHTGIMLEATSSEHAGIWAEAIRRASLEAK